MKIIIIISRKCFSKNVHMNTITTLYYVEATFLKRLMLIRQKHLGYVFTTIDIFYQEALSSNQMFAIGAMIY